MPGGRPRKWDSVDEIIPKIEKYFDEVVGTDEIPDVEGLCLRLDCNRKTLIDYENIEEFSNAIKSAKDKIAYYKKQLAMQGKIPTAVFCFDFKNNHNYSDTQKVESINENINHNNDLKGKSSKEIQEMINTLKNKTK